MLLCYYNFRSPYCLPSSTGKECNGPRLRLPQLYKGKHVPANVFRNQFPGRPNASTAISLISEGQVSNNG